MSDEILPLLAKMFPSFRGVAPDEARRRGDALGTFAARAWTAGPQAMQARGIVVPPAVHQKLAGPAPQVAQSGQNGLAFLAHMRPAFGDDHAYAAALAGFAKLYAESLRGGGAPAPAPTPAPAPAFGPASAPASGGFALPGPPMAPSGGGHDLAPLDLAPPAAAHQAAPVSLSAPQPVSLAPPQPVSLASPGGGGGGLDLAPPDAPRPNAWGDLDLAPEEPPARPSYGGLDLSDAQPAAPAPGRAAPPAPSPARGGGGLDLAPEDDGGGRPSLEDLLYGGGDPAEEALADGGGGEAGPGGGGPPKEPVARAFWSYERSGDASFLEQAAQALQQELQQAPHPMAAAAAMGGLAKVALLRGQRQQAEQLAQQALARFPACPQAVEVAVRIARGDAEAAQFTRGLIRLRFAISRRDPNELRQAATEMAQAFPQEPHPHLAMFFAASMQGDPRAIEQHLRAAWQRYPSQRFADRTFGGESDADVANSLNLYGRAPYKKMDEDGLRRTVEDTDSKDNLIAGSLKMAIGVAKMALTHPGLERPLLRRLHVAVGQGLMGLQYFELAQEEMSKALTLAPTPEEQKAVGNERVQCQALWRAFDKPGIKAQKGKYRCLNSEAVTRQLAQLLEAIKNDRQGREGELFDKGPELVQRALTEPAFRQELARAAEEEAIEDPLAQIEQIDAELAQIASEREESEERPAEKKGLFGALKAKVGSAAKGAQLKFKESQLQSKRADAVRRVAVSLAQDLNGFDFKHPFLVAFARRAASLEAFNDYLTAEEQRVQENLRHLSFSK
ncbi:MAG: hypothetical protein AB7N76_28430 [Planctomycetota bacterium]